MLQKRKYTKGWHWSGRGISKSSKETQASADNASHAELDKKEDQELSSQRFKKRTNDKNVKRIESEAVSQSVTKHEKPRLTLSDGAPEDKDARNEEYKLTENVVETPEKDAEDKEKPGKKSVIYGLIFTALGLLISIAAPIDFIGIIGLILFFIGLTLLIIGIAKNKKKKNDDREYKPKKLGFTMLSWGTIGAVMSTLLIAVSLDYGVVFVPSIALGLSILMIALAILLLRKLKSQSISRRARAWWIVFLVFSILLVVALDILAFVFAAV